MNRESGTVKLFKHDRGYGFIAPDYGADDIFVHATDVQRSGLGPLEKGQRVSFETADSPKGARAINLEEIS